jgi:hypothetical protein
MGCSAGVIALDLAQQLLERHPDEYCLVVSHENITNAHYKGADRSMQVIGQRPSAAEWRRWGCFAAPGRDSRTAASTFQIANTVAGC